MISCLAIASWVPQQKLLQKNILVFDGIVKKKLYASSVLKYLNFNYNKLLKIILF